MSENYSIGDIVVNNLLFISPRGSLNLTTSFVSFSLYESIFTPGVILDIDVLDTTDFLGTLKLSGDETIVLNAKVPGVINSSISLTLQLHELSGLLSLGAQKSKMYTLKCVSLEAMYAKTNYIQKAYYDVCSNIVKDIHSNFLSSKKDLNLEQTIGPQNIIIPQRNPFDAINMIRKRSISIDNKSSLYSYFENRKNGNQIFQYVTIESLFKKDVVKSFKQSDSINIDSKIQQDNNILSYQVNRQFSSIDKIIYGGPRKIATKNFTTQEYQVNIINTSDSNYKDGGANGKSDTSAYFKNKFLSSTNPPQRYRPRDESQRARDYIPEYSADREAYLALLLQNSLKIRVPGDFILTAGVMINCDIPNKNALTAEQGLDPLMTGNFLITRIHHKVGLVQERPRYTCIIEGIKGSFSEGIQ